MRSPEKSERAIKLKLMRDQLLGRRVEIAPRYDLWMRGARYGTVRRVYYRGDVVHVAIKMDHPQVRRHARMPVSDITHI